LPIWLSVECFGRIRDSSCKHYTPYVRMWLDLQIKTLHFHTRIEIHFIAYCNSHTHALSRHNNKTGIDKQVCSYRQPVVDTVKLQRTIIDPVRPLRSINRVAWGPILFHCTPARLMVWSGLLWPSDWPTVHTTWSPVSNGIVNPPTCPLQPAHPLYATLVILQAVFKTSLKTSQSNQ